MSLSIKYVEESNYLIRYFSGQLKPNDLVSSWEFLFDEKLKDQKFIGVISVYSDVELDMEMDDFDCLLDLFKKNDSLLNNIKIAVVMETHIDRVFPLFSLRYSQFNIRSFSTLETAQEWMTIETK